MAILARGSVLVLGAVAFVLFALSSAFGRGSGDLARAGCSSVTLHKALGALVGQPRVDAAPAVRARVGTPSTW